jgi:hypothetical protein
VGSPWWRHWHWAWTFLLQYFMIEGRSEMGVGRQNSNTKELESRGTICRYILLNTLLYHCPGGTAHHHWGNFLHSGWHSLARTPAGTFPALDITRGFPYTSL